MLQIQEVAGWTMSGGVEMSAEDKELSELATALRIRKSMFGELNENMGKPFKDILIHPLDHSTVIDAIRKACESYVGDGVRQLTFEVMPTTEEDRIQRRCTIVVGVPRELVEPSAVKIEDRINVEITLEEPPNEL